MDEDEAKEEEEEEENEDDEEGTGVNDFNRPKMDVLVT